MTFDQRHEKVSPASRLSGGRGIWVEGTVSANVLKVKHVCQSAPQEPEELAEIEGVSAGARFSRESQNMAAGTLSLTH